MIDLDEIEIAARKPWYCRSKLEDNLLSPEVLVELITRLRQAEKDAARYRWLREQPCSDWEIDGEETSHIDVTLWRNDGFDKFNSGESLLGCSMDVAIDEAMQCSK